MDLLDLIQADGFVMKKMAGTNGGEYAGPCPVCGGTDRFRVWPEHKGGRYWCRACGKSGDMIQYLRDAQGLSYREACEQLNLGDKTDYYSKCRSRELQQRFIPKEVSLPVEIWMKKAKDFLTIARRDLWAESSNVGRSFLRDRGLKEATIRQAGLGWNPTDIYADREDWGLPLEARPDGRMKRLWLPAGLIIPYIKDGHVIRIRIRRPMPGDGPRYVIIPGSAIKPMVWNTEASAIVIVESELDGLLLHQEASDLAGIMAIGSVSARPDRTCHDILRRSASILVSLDADGPGARQSWKYWPETYGSKAKRWPVPIGKDPSDAWKAGLNIRAWIKAGLF